VRRPADDRADRQRAAALLKKNPPHSRGIAVAPCQTTGGFSRIGATGGTRCSPPLTCRLGIDSRPTLGPGAREVGTGLATCVSECLRLTSRRSRLRALVLVGNHPSETSSASVIGCSPRSHRTWASRSRAKAMLCVAGGRASGAGGMAVRSLPGPRVRSNEAARGRGLTATPPSGPRVDR
jgi:hypothetical protein